MKLIIKNVVQKITWHVKRLGRQSAEAEPDANIQQSNAGRLFTINTHCFMNKRFLTKDGKGRRLFQISTKEKIVMVEGNFFCANLAYCHKYIQFTPKKDLIPSYSIMAGGVLV